MTTIAPAYLSAFGESYIPTARGRFQWPSATRPSTVPTINGAFDMAGTGLAELQLPYTLSYTGAVHDATDTSAIVTALDTLRAHTGSSDILYMALANGTTRWAMARLVNVSPEMVITERAVVMFNLTFQVISTWRGTVHGAFPVGTGPAAAPIILFANGLYAYFASAMTLPASPADVNIANAGNAHINDLGLIIEAGSAAITDLQLTTPHGVALEYTGTLASGARLIIDGGARTITNDGTDAFNGLNRLSTHTIGGWFYIPAATEVLTVTYTGGAGDSLILPVYADSWA